MSTKERKTNELGQNEKVPLDNAPLIQATHVISDDIMQQQSYKDVRQDRNVSNIKNEQSEDNSNVVCIYLLSIVAFIVPLIGLIAMYFYDCGIGLPKQANIGFRTLTVCTLMGFIVYAIIVITQLLSDNQLCQCHCYSSSDDISLNNNNRYKYQTI